jgi:hypothetical protein
MSKYGFKDLFYDNKRVLCENENDINCYFIPKVHKYTDKKDQKVFEYDYNKIFDASNNKNTQKNQKKMLSDVFDVNDFKLTKKYLVKGPNVESHATCSDVFVMFFDIESVLRNKFLGLQLSKMKVENFDSLITPQFEADESENGYRNLESFFIREKVGFGSTNRCCFGTITLNDSFSDNTTLNL